MNQQKLEQFREKIRGHVKHFEENGRFALQHRFAHHKDVCVHDHVCHVAFIALKLAHKLHLKVDEDSLVRAALLHDYYLYDWHDDEDWHNWHGLRHPRFAAENAERDFGLDEKEKDAILTHMFPLTLRPPKHKIGWLVTMADKICTFKECWTKNWREQLAL